MAREENERSATVGLCATCRYARLLSNRRGSEFWRCAVADTDPSLPRYPQLPVLRCRAFSAVASGEASKAAEGESRP